MVTIMITADDFGITEGITTGILQACRNGAVNAVSVMANGTWVIPGVRELQAYPDVAVGAHLQFVGEDQPALTHREAPTLISRAGRYPATWRHLSAAVLAGRTDPDDVRAEARAQLAHLRDELGLTLVHVNTHQHVHLLPSIATVVVEEAATAGSHYVRAPSSTAWSARAAVIHRWRKSLARKAKAQGLVTNDAFVGLDEAGKLDLGAVRAGMDRHHRADLLEINCHPGTPTAVDKDRYAWNYRWEDELAMLTSGAMQALMSRPGTVPMSHRTWEELSPARRA